MGLNYRVRNVLSAFDTLVAVRLRHIKRTASEISASLVVSLWCELGYYRKTGTTVDLAGIPLKSKPTRAL